MTVNTLVTKNIKQREINRSFPLEKVYTLVRADNDKKSKCKVILTGNYLIAVSL